jgi:NAD(P)-dependent dehydrogenase (short-subunit alcohol dehydrogenase family)
MLQQGQGWIINISSERRHLPGPGPYTDVRPVRAFMYAVTQGSPERLTQGLAVEYQAQGISANVLRPSAGCGHRAMCLA